MTDLSTIFNPAQVELLAFLLEELDPFTLSPADRVVWASIIILFEEQAVHSFPDVVTHKAGHFFYSTKYQQEPPTN